MRPTFEEVKAMIEALPAHKKYVTDPYTEEVYFFNVQGVRADHNLTDDMPKKVWLIKLAEEYLANLAATPEKSRRFCKGGTCCRERTSTFYSRMTVYLNQERSMKKVPATDEEIYERACKAWQRRCQREGTIADQPSEACSVVMGNSVPTHIDLGNINGCFARYRYDAITDHLYYLIPPKKEVK